MADGSREIYQALNISLTIKSKKKMLKIEKDIPIVARNKYNEVPFAEMVVGDSVLVPLNGQKLTSVQPTLLRAARDYATLIQQELEFTTKYEKSGGIAIGVRIWRIK